MQVVNFTFVSKEQYKHILDKLQNLPKKINQLIWYTNKKLKE